MRLDRGLREGGGLELVLWIYRLLLLIFFLKICIFSY